MTETDAPPRKVPPWDPEPRWSPHGTLLRVGVGGTTVLHYADGTGSPAFDAPRPHLHPLRTLAGVPVTDAAPPDHSWHLGLSVGVQDVDGANLWGGRTYLREDGYTWRRDHGRTVHRAWEQRLPGAVTHRLDWLGPDDAVLLVETRELAWEVLDDRTWRLDLATTLRCPSVGPAGPVALGSPGSNGREAAGYGGIFWRFAPCEDVDVRTADARGEDRVHGSRPADHPGRWLAWSAHVPAAAPPVPPGYPTWSAAGVPAGGAEPESRTAGDVTVVALPGDDATAADPWFVRVGGYPGLGSALAWDTPVRVTPDAPLRRSMTFLVADGRWSDDDVVARLADLRPAADAPAATEEDTA